MPEGLTANLTPDPTGRSDCVLAIIEVNRAWRCLPVAVHVSIGGDRFRAPDRFFRRPGHCTASTTLIQVVRDMQPGSRSTNTLRPVSNRERKAPPPKKRPGHFLRDSAALAKVKLIMQRSSSLVSCSAD